jgi:hypothetical protein
LLVELVLLFAGKIRTRQELSFEVADALEAHEVRAGGS